MGVVEENDVGSVHTHTWLACHIRQDRRRCRSVHNLDIVGGLKELHLPAQQRGSGSRVVCGESKLNHTYAVGCGADHLMMHVTAVRQVTITTQHVDFRVVDVCIGSTERSGIICRSRHNGTETQVAVRVDGELRVVGASKIEGKPDVRHH